MSRLCQITGVSRAGYYRFGRRPETRQASMTLRNQGPQNHFLHLHRPLPRGLRVRVHVSHALLLSPPAQRTDHLLIREHIMCYRHALREGLEQMRLM